MAGPTQVTQQGTVQSPNDVPKAEIQPDAGSAVNQSANIRSSFSTYMQNPAADPDTDRSIRDQYNQNIATADSHAVSLMQGEPTTAQQGHINTLVDQANTTKSDLQNNNKLDNTQPDIDAANNQVSALQADKVQIQNAIVATPPETFVANDIPPVTPSPSASTYNGPITTPDLIPAVQPEYNTTDALAQSQQYRDSLTTYMANPVADKATDAAIKAGLTDAINNSDKIVGSLASNLADSTASANVIGKLANQAVNTAKMMNSNPNANGPDKSNATGTAMAIQKLYEGVYNQIGTAPPVDTSAVNSILNNLANNLGPTGNNILPVSTTGSTGSNSSSNSSSILNISSNIYSNIATNNLTDDGRVRLTPKNKYFLNSTILNPLLATNGLMFPYTPTLSWSVAPNYSTQSTTHANQDYRAYVNTPAITINITCPFTAQNTTEATYMLGCLHFLRTVTKMHFGTDNNGRLGLPPPVLLLNGYGKYVFNNLPVIVQSFNMDMPNTCNYMTVTVDGTVNQVPVMTNIIVTCVVQTTPQFQRTFNWDNFANGTLMKSGGWF